MSGLAEHHLVQAIHSEIGARDVYATLSGKIDVAEGSKMMMALSKEEEKHRLALAARYRAVYGKDYEFDPSIDAGPDYSFLENSVFGYTQALEALKLALTAEVDAGAFYSQLLSEATDSADLKMLRRLIRFEGRHKKTLEREIRRLESGNHWQLG